MVAKSAAALAWEVADAATVDWEMVIYGSADVEKTEMAKAIALETADEATVALVTVVWQARALVEVGVVQEMEWARNAVSERQRQRRVWRRGIW